MAIHHMQAADIFPWADIPSGLTLGGLLDHAALRHRQAWARVLLGTDEQLTTALARVIPNYAVNFNLPPEAHGAYVRMRLGKFADILRVGDQASSWRDFAAGYWAGMQYEPPSEAP